MNIEKLELKNFRNYQEQAVYFGNRVNILYGRNAQGKTNILEALYMTATGKSHRTNNYQDMVRKDATGFHVKLDAVANERTNHVEIDYSKEKGKYAEVNGIKRDKISDILGIMNMIMFSPETLEIIKGSPQLRRKFVDILLCQISKNYLYSLQQYNLVLKNKASALKKSRYEKKYDDIIPILNEYLSKHGGRIAYIRHKTIIKLNAYMKSEMLNLSENKENSNIVYKTYTDLKNSSYDENYFIEQLNSRLQEGSQREKELGQCLYGPHRDDMEIMLNEMNSRLYCSQGQQRSLALSLVMAELLFVEEMRGDKPVLLLDDVLSELDLKRQEHLLKGLKDTQTIITTTELDSIKSIVHENIVCCYEVESGHASRVY